MLQLECCTGSLVLDSALLGESHLLGKVLLSCCKLLLLMHDLFSGLLLFSVSELHRFVSLGHIVDSSLTNGVDLLHLLLCSEGLGLRLGQTRPNGWSISPANGHRFHELLRSLIPCLGFSLKDAEGILVALGVHLAKAQQGKLGAQGTWAQVDCRLRDGCFGKS